MASWDDIHWIRTSRDIPDNDLLNFTVDELHLKYPKIPKDDLVLERCGRFPRRFSLPPSLKTEGLRHRKTLVVRSPADLRDSIFEEHTAQEILKQYPRFTQEEVEAEVVLRAVRKLHKGIQEKLRQPDQNNMRIALNSAENALALIRGLRKPTNELEEFRKTLGEIHENLEARRQAFKGPD